MLVMNYEKTWFISDFNFKTVILKMVCLNAYENNNNTSKTH